jgi:hypothetical protein
MIFASQASVFSKGDAQLSLPSFSVLPGNLHRSWINGTVTQSAKENKSNSFRELKIGKQ